MLDDLDEETLGVFVARGSYQRGALMVAAMSNILRLSIDRIGDDEEVLVEHTEILDAEIKLRRDDIDRDRATGGDDLYGDEVISYDVGVTRRASTWRPPCVGIAELVRPPTRAPLSATSGAEPSASEPSSSNEAVGTIEFASRGVNAPAVPSVTIRSRRLEFGGRECRDRFRGLRG